MHSPARHPIREWAVRPHGALPVIYLPTLHKRRDIHLCEPRENAANAEKFTYIPALVESWQEGVPEFRPRFAEWPTITEIVQEWGTKMMLGEVSVDEGAKTIGTKMEEVLQKAGYYDGKKPLAQ